MPSNPDTADHLEAALQQTRQLEHILSDLVVDIRVAETLQKTPDEMLVPSDRAKAKILKLIQAEDKES